MIGNYRHHIIVECKKCHRKMGYYKQSVEVTCIECERLLSNQKGVPPLKTPPTNPN